MSVLNRWHHKVHEIPRAGITQHREAAPDICEELARQLAIPGCNSLVADYRIQNAGKGHFELTGRIKATLMRTCVVSLEPIKETIDERLDCTFLPPDEIPDAQPEEEEALSVEELEPILNDRIEVGRVIYEVLAASMDPYPRALDAKFEAQPPTAEDEEPAEHPFAALSRLKTPKGETQ